MLLEDEGECKVTRPKDLEMRKRRRGRIAGHGVMRCGGRGDGKQAGSIIVYSPGPDQKREKGHRTGGVSSELD